MTHRGIPWPLVRKAHRLLYRLRPSVDVPDQDHLVTNASLDTIRVALGKRHWTNSWELSYAYVGEDLNMRRPEYDETDGRPWKQTHVRGFDHGTHAELHAHFEYEPTEYPEAHLHAESLDVHEGLDRLASALEDAGIAYDLVVA